MACRARAGILVAVLAGVTACSSSAPGGSPAADGYPPPNPSIDLATAPRQACGGVGPYDLLTATPGAEREDSPEAAALRAYLARPIETAPADGWIVLTREPGWVLFGRWTRAVGIKETVAFERDEEGRWQFASSGGCDGVIGVGGRAAERVTSYRGEGEDLVLSWDGGTCVGDDRPQRADVQVRESPEQVSVLLVPIPRSYSEEICAGLGTQEESHAQLMQPVGDRTVVDAGVVGEPVVGEQGELRRATEARQDAEAFAQRQADAFCAEGAATLGRAPKVAFVSTYHDVHAALPGLPWEPLPADAGVAQCMVSEPDGSITAAVFRPGYPAFVYARDVQPEHLYDRFTP